MALRVVEESRTIPHDFQGNLVIFTAKLNKKIIIKMLKSQQNQKLQKNRKMLKMQKMQKMQKIEKK